MATKEMYLALGLLLSLAGCAISKDCNYVEFSNCVKEVIEIESGDFHITDETQMMEVCNTKQRAIQCASSFVTDCMKKGERDLFEATTGGKLKVIEEMCTEGSEINTGYLKHIDCWGKMKEEVEFCSDKFNESQRALLTAPIEDRLKVFHGCCAFEWHRNCLAQVASAKCSNDAGQFVHHVATVLGGDVQYLICSSSYASCHGLYGVDMTEVEEKLENIKASNSVPNLNRSFLHILAGVYIAFVFMKGL